MWTFRAMNTEVSVTAPWLADADERDLASAIAGVFAETEQRFSRFRDDSELSALNRTAEPVVVSPELLEVLLAARGHVAETNGLFDPAIGAALRAAGYDRTFVRELFDRAAPTAGPSRATFDELEIDEQTHRVVRPAHLQLDFGGFLKGRTVDVSAAMLPVPAAIDAGGDAMLRGGGADGAGWLVEVEDPFDARATLVTLRVRDRALATSAANRRCWRVGAELAHHLIDPRTSAPSCSDLAQVTVLAPSAERADVLAKVVFLLGAQDGARFVEGHTGLGAVLVTRSREIRIVGEVEIAHA